MPKAQKADWELAQDLYMQGLPHALIAEIVNVTVESLRKHASRHLWHQMRTESALSAAEIANGTDHGADSRISRVRERLLAQVEAQLKVLEANPPTKAAELFGRKGQEGRASVLKRLVDSFEGLYPEQKSTGLVMMDWLTTRPEEKPAQVEAPPSIPVAATVEKLPETRQ